MTERTNHDLIAELDASIVKESIGLNLAYHSGSSGNAQHNRLMALVEERAKLAHEEPPDISLVARLRTFTDQPERAAKAVEEFYGRRS